MGGFEHAFSPIKIGGLTIRNRIEAAPAMPILAGLDGGFFAAMDL
jgi:2,4-dienoyl-CoA reductase-like NADH-dependent reductase (Old Yellow Enzyme family)